MFMCLCFCSEAAEAENKRRGELERVKALADAAERTKQETALKKQQADAEAAARKAEQDEKDRQTKLEAERRAREEEYKKQLAKEEQDKKTAAAEVSASHCWRFESESCLGLRPMQC